MLKRTSIVTNDLAVDDATKKIICCLSMNRCETGVRSMPSEIFDVDRFVEISGHADYCAVKRLKDIVKLKLRTNRRLYTFKISPTKAEEIIKRLQCEVREI
jgi:ferritin-like protein